MTLLPVSPARCRPGRVYVDLRAALLAAGRSRPVPCQHPTRRALWFGKQPSEQAAAVAGCLVCPVLDPCRRYALAASEPFGVWGATTAVDRRQETP